MIQPSHPHLVHRVNLASQAQVVVFQAVVPHPSQAHALLPANHALVLHLAAHLAVAHFQVPVAHFHPLALHLVLRVPALHLAIRPLAQAVPVLLFQAHRAVLHHLVVVHLALHPLVQALLRVIQPFLLLVPLAAHLLAVLLHLRARVFRNYKVSIGIRRVMRVGLLLHLWDLALVLRIV